MVFKASMDIVTKVLTIALTILFAVIIYSQLPWPDFDSGPVYITAILVLGYGGAYLYRPLGYTVTDKELLIHRPIGSIRIPRVSITEIIPIGSGKIFGAIRLFGVGGLFGYYGTFYTFSMGRMSYYVTNKNKALLLKTSAKRKIVISPDDTAGFLAEFNTRTAGL